MNVALFLRGLVVGLSMAAPVGPIGILCIRRTLRDGRLAGFVSGLGAATADAAYGGIAGLGLTAVPAFLAAHRWAIALLGGGFLCWLGIRTFRRRLPAETPAPSPQNLLGDWSSTLVLTLANPATLLTFAAVFAALGLGATPRRAAAGCLVLGVFVGSASWWLILSVGVAAVRSRMGPTALQLVNRASGIVLFLLGAAAVARAYPLR